MTVVDSETVDLIGAIYDAVLDRELWPVALDRVRRRFNLHNAVLGVNRFGHQPFSLTIPVNIPEKYLAMQSQEYADEVLRLWGGAEQVARHPLEEPVALSERTDFSDVRSNLYYRDFGEPQGLDDLVAIILTRDRRQVGNVAFGRHRDFGPVTQDVLAGLRVLAPHFRRAILITGILEEERKSRTLFEEVLDALRSGVVLVDRRGHIIHANRAGQASIEAGDPLHSDNGKLVLRGEVVPGHLETAIAAAAEGDVPLGRRGIAVPGTRADGTPYVTHVMPLANRTVDTGVPGEAVAAVFVVDRDEEPQLVVDAATLLYSLTPAEARVFELVVAGHSSAEIATLLGIAPSTLKWHTLQLFEKTGQHRRSDLVRLAGRLRPGA